MEKSQWWPQVKDYFHMANWILNYREGVTTQPANCKLVLTFWEIILLLYILLMLNVSILHTVNHFGFHIQLFI